ncbi:MAG TPA: O-antigen ligase family protein [Candidatus Ozemobacteraceae bacterium]|nr:O-antigen ligase family protein [Candidatus Ozemobacteraceae bacterium]
MDTPAAGREIGIEERFRTLRGVWNFILLAVTACWVYLYEFPWRGDLLGLPAIDLAWMAACVGIASWRGRSFAENLLWITLSRHLHLAAMGEFEAFQALVSISWAAWGACLALAETDEQRMLLAGYHLGLTFDAGMCRPIGLGMSFGLDAAALDLLLVTAGMSRIANGRLPAIRWLPAALLAGALGFLAIAHAGGPGSNTAVMLLALASLTIFFLAPGTAAAAGDRLMQALVLAGFPIVLAAFGMMLGEADLWTAMQKRVFAGGLHPNLLAAYALGMLTFIIRPAEWDLIPAPARRVARAAACIAYLGILLASGGRAAILVFLLTALLLHRRRFADACTRRTLVPALVIGLLCIYKLFDTSLWFEVFHNERYLIWRAAVDQIRAHPWLGHGMMAFGQLPLALPDALRMIPADWIYPHTHNLFLEIALSGGIPLLVLFLIAGFLWGTSAAVSAGAFGLGGAFLALGLFDFVWFTPSLMALGMSAYSETARGSGSSDEAVPGKKWVPWSFAGILLIMIYGIFSLHRAPFLFRQSVELLGNRNPAWVETLDRAATVRPTDLAIRLQRLLIRWSTGTAPSEADLAELDDIAAGWPGYYLPRFLRGRLREMAGHPVKSLEDLAASVSLEPRDLLGIRWARLALARAAAGTDATDAAWEAVLRGGWGPSLVLDHPAVGATMTSLLVSRWTAAAPKTVYEAQMIADIGICLARRGVPLPAKELDSALARSFPEHARDAWNLLDLVRVPPSEPMADPSWGMGCLAFMLELAAKANRKEIFEDIYSKIQAKIVRRSKNNENLRSDFLSTGFLPPDAAFERLQRLRESDPGNPWIIERYGDLLAASGRPDEAREEWRTALNLCSSVRLEPVFSDGPRPWALGSTGDQWTLAFETALRRYDPDAGGYHRQKWDAFMARLRAKAAGQGGGRP